jgi:hypothetical protein
METLTAACLAVGLTVVLYVGWLGRNQRRLQIALETLEARLQHESSHSEPPAKAA